MGDVGDWDDIIDPDKSGLAAARQRELLKLCNEKECAAFSVTPKDGFKHGGAHSILFDHTLISAVGESFPFKFRCGNIMALSAPSKGLPEKEGAGDKYMSFFFENGEQITKAWVDLVNNIVYKNREKPGNWNYETISSLKGAEYKNEYKVIHDKIAGEMGKFLEKHVFSKNTDWDKKAIQDALSGNLVSKRDDNDYADAGRIDKAYQLLFYNKLWETQKFGGFDAGKDGPYGVFYHGNIDKKGEVIEDAAKKLKFLLEQSIEDVDVLFLCESVQYLNEILGNDYTCVSIERDTENGEIYSAIYKNKGNITGITEVDVLEGMNSEEKKKLNAKEFGVFEITSKKGKSKVAVVHTKEKLLTGKKQNKKSQEMEDVPAGADGAGWDTFLSGLVNVGVDYIVGDTNMTKGKVKNKIDKSKFFEYEKWWNERPNVESVVVPTRKIKKVRLGNRLDSNVNGFLNNQINKGGDPASEVDGMVILKLKLSGGGGESKEEQGGGRRRRRRKTKKKRKSKRKSKRKRKPKRKTKRKRKRRTKKR